MHRRQMIMAGAAALAAPLVAPTLVRAQTMDSMKLPILAGGDYATLTSKLALRRANSSIVRTFAKLEITEQAAVAEAFGSRPGAAGVLPKHAALLQQLEAAPDAEFDLLYVEGQIDGHQELLTLHKAYARRGSDPAAQGAAIVAAPAIQTHLAMLKSIRAAA